jgi:hypothetical protein
MVYDQKYDLEENKIALEQSHDIITKKLMEKIRIIIKEMF